MAQANVVATVSVLGVIVLAALAFGAVRLVDSALGLSERLDEADIAVVESAIAQAQDGFTAEVSAQTASCEGLCQQTDIRFLPAHPDFTTDDIRTALVTAYDTLEELSKNDEFSYCFAYDRDSSEAQAYLAEQLRGLGTGSHEPLGNFDPCFFIDSIQIEKLR